jgi:hypothetical protein
MLISADASAARSDGPPLSCNAHSDSAHYRLKFDDADVSLVMRAIMSLYSGYHAPGFHSFHTAANAEGFRR